MKTMLAKRQTIKISKIRKMPSVQSLPKIISEAPDATKRDTTHRQDKRVTKMATRLERPTTLTKGPQTGLKNCNKGLAKL